MANAVLAERSGCAGERTDHELVSAVRCGDDRAFEQLYTRYQRRIAAFVGAKVKDHGRAEDITQEVFVSALRRMRQTERPIAFKPWIYEIAKNACIDAYRRGRRAEEVSYDADDRLSPADHVRLVATGPEPDAAVDTKHELDNLCGAFGGLSESHHEILVLRELEGLSYNDIGERMGMSRPAVESTLFRARKRLGEEYDELASGARCLHTQAIIADGGRVGRRNERKLARHLSHCQPCRRLAAQAGLDVPVPVRRRIADKIAGLLPLPGFLRFRRGGDDAASTSFGGGGGWVAHAPAFADAMSSGWSKGAAALAALLIAGAGVGTFAEPGKRDERGTGYQAIEQPAVERSGGERGAPQRGERSTASERRAADRRRGAARREQSGRGRAGDRPRGGGAGGGAGADAGARSAAPGGAAPSGGGGSGGGGAAGGKLPSVTLPGGGKPPVQAPDPPAVELPPVQPPGVQETTESVTGAMPDVTEQVPDVPDQLPVTPELPAVPDPGAVVPKAAAPVTDAVDDTVGALPTP
jgi:RNA polymerase sigma factor (sigma-70 family)